MTLTEVVKCEIIKVWQALDDIIDEENGRDYCHYPIKIFVPRYARRQELIEETIFSVIGIVGTVCLIVALLVIR
jgi:hypothetical protein